MFTKLIFTPIGTLQLIEREGFLTNICLGKDGSGSSETTPLLEEAARQLTEYFAGTRYEFELPLNPDGTAFQRKVWRALMEIPYSKVISYKQLAQNIGQPTALRAVGGANHRNPLPIVIPCHRVIASDGSLGGFGGGLEIKRALLELEAGFSR